MRPTNRRRTLAIAGCVGTLLVAINQSGPLLSGPRTALLWARVALDYVVPFAVSNLGVLAGTHAGKSPVMPAGAEPQSGGSPLARPRRRARVAVLAIVIVMVAVAGGGLPRPSRFDDSGELGAVEPGGDPHQLRRDDRHLHAA